MIELHDIPSYEKFKQRQFEEKKSYFESLNAFKITRAQAAEICGLSYRQFGSYIRRYNIHWHNRRPYFADQTNYQRLSTKSFKQENDVRFWLKKNFKNYEIAAMLNLKHSIVDKIVQKINHL